MKKSILNLGKALNKVEQKQVNGSIKDAEAYCDVETYGVFFCCQMNTQYCI